MANLISCFHCGHRVNRHAARCPGCNRDKFNPESYVACISCGKNVHRDANRCGECGEEDFKGKPCGVCAQNLRRQDAIVGLIKFIPPPEQLNNTAPRYYHFACIERYFVPPGPFRCKDCGSQLPPLNALTLAKKFAGWMPCGSCGCPSPYLLEHRGTCSHCGLPAYSFQVRRYRKEMGKLQRKYGRRYFAKPEFKHDFCGEWGWGKKTTGKGCVVVLGVAVLAWVFLSLMR